MEGGKALSWDTEEWEGQKLAQHWIRGLAGTSATLSWGSRQGCQPRVVSQETGMESPGQSQGKDNRYGGLIFQIIISTRVQACFGSLICLTPQAQHYLIVAPATWERLASIQC